MIRSRLLRHFRGLILAAQPGRRVKLEVLEHIGTIALTCFKGTRMPVSAIFENIEAGASIDDILEWFEGLDRTQVEAVLEFVARSLDRAPEYIP